ncbi:DUF3592 domain-containing protein [Streptomyces kunmingensis]|uniref:DUF3592 domain-containing protein n=1 Tax=Streptomyces kunmingensis TaxID=68225 RepID=A0ABU6CQ40_9ACTN|nr:DUF3592 domain-containing protein [Streptomyces kunmingensis]MEB3966848.1 DUF3592 domain-containing protein [Streptomyces kunmingensis]
MSISYASSAERARGTVTDLEWRTSHSSGSHRNRSSSSTVAYPVVEFTSADGETRTFRSSGGSNPPSYERGEQVDVLYRADSPEDARIDGFLSMWLLPLIFSGIGLLIAGIGTTVAIVRRRSGAGGVRTAPVVDLRK